MQKLILCHFMSVLPALKTNCEHKMYHYQYQKYLHGLVSGKVKFGGNNGLTCSNLRDSTTCNLGTKDGGGEWADSSSIPSMMSSGSPNDDEL